MLTELFNGTDNYNCTTCIHGKTCNCESVGSINQCCKYWYHPDSEIQGLAYESETFEEKMPLFV